MEFEQTSRPCGGLHWVVTEPQLQKAAWEVFASAVHPETLLCINTGLCPAESTAPGSQRAFRQTHGCHHCVCFSPLEDFHVKCQLRGNGWMLHKGYKNTWNKSVFAALGWTYPLQNLHPSWPNSLDNLLGHREKIPTWNAVKMPLLIFLFAEIVIKSSVFMWVWWG